METDDLQPDDAARAEAPPNREWFGRRKQIESREITPATSDVEIEMLAAARGSLKPADVIDIPSLRNTPPPELILDPTLFSVRQRRPGQNFAYRATQLMIAAAFVGAAVGIANSIVGHRLRGMISAGLGCLLCAAAIKVMRKSRLAYRLRGYVAAVGIFSALAVAFCLMPFPYRAETPPREPETKVPATNPV